MSFILRVCFYLYVTGAKIIKIYCMAKDSRKEFISKQGNRINSPQKLPYLV